MYGRKIIVVMGLLLTATLFLWGVDRGNAEEGERGHPPKGTVAPSLQSGVNTDLDRHNEYLQWTQQMLNSIKASGQRFRGPLPEAINQMPSGPVRPPYPSKIVGPAVAANPLFPPGIGFNPVVDYTLPNFAQSPSIRKFVDSLPGLGLQGCTPGTGTPPNVTGGTCNQNNLGEFIPIAIPDTASFPTTGIAPASDYYELGVAQYSRQMHTDLPATTLRSYYIKGDTATDPNAGGTPQYLGPAIIARTYHPDKPAGSTGFIGGYPLGSAVNGKPVRFRFENHLPLSTGGADVLPFPLDETIMGSGMGPQDLTGAACDYGLSTCAKFTQNRISIHLHGGHTPGSNDGPPSEWFTPTGDPISGTAIPGYPWGMKKGPDFQDVPDMVTGPLCVGGAKCITPSANDGIETLYYTNQQSPRLLFFHDHAWGITRLTVYDGMAAPYLIVDDVEDDLIDGTNNSGVFTAAGISPTKILPDNGTPNGVYRYGIPLVIQDKTFVADASTDAIRNAYPATRPFPAEFQSNERTSVVDPLWVNYTNNGLGMPGGNLWMPHEYMPIENIFDPRGYTDTGRWDYGPFMIPAAIPKYLTLPSPSITPEAFQDTVVVNGTAFPFVNLPPDALRFRILDAANDRSFNLQLYSAAVGNAHVTFTGTCTTMPIASTVVRGGVVTDISVLRPGAGCAPGLTATITDIAGNTPTTTATVTPILDSTGAVTGFTFTGPNFGGSGYLAGTICKAGSLGYNYATPPAGQTWENLCTEVAMVPAAVDAGNPPTWPIDGRDGGVPDPATQGPPWLQVGNESGWLAQLAVWPQNPVDYEAVRQNLPFAGVTSHTLYLMGAMRADVIVDFSHYTAGDMLIMYNDAPTPMPMFNSSYDYYTDSPDKFPVGAYPTPAGFGPNIRTLMQIRIAGTKASSLNFDVTATPGFDHSPTGSFLPPNLSGPFGATFTALQTVLPKAFAADQEKPIVPQLAYNAAFPGFATGDIYGQGYMDSLNITGAVQPVDKILTLAGAGYTVAPTVQIVPAAGGCPGGLPAGTVGINPIGAVTLVTAGTGYTSVPTVTLGAPLAGGVQATAAATISGGVVTGIVIVEPGSNYNTAVNAVVPTCTISAPGGGGTTATCSVTAATAGLVGSVTVTNPGGCINQPLAFIIAAPGNNGTGATASVLLKGSLAPTGKNLTEGFDPDYGRINIFLGSTPNPLTPTIGAGPVVGIAKFIDPPTEYLNNGEVVLWRITHLGVDSHVMHFHLFDLQVINRVDYANTVKQPYPDELGWREAIRTNPFEDIFIALKPTQPVLPFTEPHEIRPLDPSTPVGSTTNFLPIAPPIGVPAVAQTTNTLTDFGFEYVWHCHILNHEEFDMMRPVVFQIAPVPLANGPSVAWDPTLGKYHVAIRRADSKVYVGTANVDGILNFDFVPLTGTTATAPSITYDSDHNKVIVGWKGNATTNLFVGSLNPDGTGWSGTTLFAVGTADSPAIVWNPNTHQLQYAIRASTNTAWVGSLNFNGATFSGASQAQFSATAISFAPSIAIAATGPQAGRVQLAARMSSGNNVAVGNVVLPSTFSGWHNLSTYTTSAGPGIAWNSISNKLDVVWKGNTNTSVFKAGINGDSTTGLVASAQVSGAVSTAGPAAGTDPLLRPLNIFSLNAGNVAGYLTTGP